jgi:hypothetical protein
LQLVDIARKKMEYLKAKIDELETSNKKKNITDLYKGNSDCYKGCQPRTNTVKDEKGDFDIDTYSIFTRLRNHFSQLLNVHGANDVRQTGLRKYSIVASA